VARAVQQEELKIALARQRKFWFFNLRVRGILVNGTANYQGGINQQVEHTVKFLAKLRIFFFVDHRILA